MSGRQRLALISVVLVVALCALGAWQVSSRHASAPPIAVAPPTTTTTTRPKPHAVAKKKVSGVTTVATIRPSGAPGSDTPGGPPTRLVPGEWYKAASVLPVIAQRPGWVEVRLAQRPNESTTWVPVGDVTLAHDAYKIVIDLSTEHLQLFKSGKQVANFPAGIGTVDDPTPTGEFFVAFVAASPSPGYGAFILATSAHSNVITDFDNSGDAITAIHGPLGEDAAIGTTGAKVSHGCIRLHDSDLLQLKDVPMGTPISIVV
jgi:lipoprotein-anchoring transpeptidase ErfK/SrfK